MQDNELLFQVALTKLPKVGAITAKNLISYCGSARQVFKEKKRHLLKIPKIGPQIADAIVQQQILAQAEKEMSFIEKNKLQVLFYANDDYPYRLKQYPDCPVIIYYKGNANLNHHRILSIVGTRRISDYGRDLVSQCIHDLQPYDVLVCSGLAYGVDTEVHKMCIQENIPTVAVLGHGLDRIYPPENRKLAKQMIEAGGLCTEFGIETTPDRENFPMRNRIVAAMADALIVVETQTEGGSMITAQLANSYHKDVFAFPGRAFDTFSSGCNLLIKKNLASLIENANDLVENMFWSTDKNRDTKQVQTQLFVDLNEDEMAVVNLLKKHEDLSVDFLHKELLYNSSKLAACLLHLEFKGIIRSHPGKRYSMT